MVSFFLDLSLHVCVSKLVWNKGFPNNSYKLSLTFLKRSNFFSRFEFHMISSFTIVRSILLYELSLFDPNWKTSIWNDLTCLGTSESRAGWLVLVMGCFWGLELLPLAGTSLLPVVFLPLLNILSECFYILDKIFLYFLISSTSSLKSTPQKMPRSTLKSRFLTKSWFLPKLAVTIHFFGPN